MSNPENHSPRISVRLPPDLKAWLAREAHLRGVEVSEIVRAALKAERDAGLSGAAQAYLTSALAHKPRKR